jgi:hypothetical protein
MLAVTVRVRITWARRRQRHGSMEPEEPIGRVTRLISKEDT